jgi:protein gp37
MCDWLDNEVPVEWLADFIGLIMSTPNLDWMLLTKRPENFFNRLTAVNCSPGFGLIDRAKRVGGERIAMLATWVEFWRTGSAAPHNVWIGTSVEDQQRADERIPELLQIQARVRFLSVEPLLGPVDLEMALEDFQPLNADLTRKPSPVQWVIVGGESGPKARPCNIAWVRDIVRQCAAAGVPCFVKQLGSFCIEEEGSQRRRILWDHPKGGDPDEWPEDLRVRQFPESQEGGGK